METYRISLEVPAGVPNEITSKVSSGEYTTLERYLVLHLNGSEASDEVRTGDELMIYEYSGSNSTAGVEVTYCAEDGTMRTRTEYPEYDDKLVSVYDGTAISDINNNTVLFNVEGNDLPFLEDSEDGGQTRAVARRDEVVEQREMRYYHYVRYFIRRRYLTIPVPVTSKDDYHGAVSESNANAIVEEAKRSLIPGFIDMEKIKFAPVHVNPAESATSIVSNIIMRLHILHRDESFAIDNHGWIDGHLEEDYDDNNGLTSDSLTIYPSSADSQATLIGYVGFTDGDVRYQKKKLSKSFLRLSYYSTNDLIDNSLYGYSTVFVNGGEMFGKYSTIDRQKAFVDLYDDDEYYDYRYVQSSGTSDGTRLDFTFTLTDEYNEERSAEGFNIYLFSTDFAGRTEPTTIYMKVEFNHAGRGKTMQMMRPDASYSAVTTVGEYRNAVFIPINVYYEPSIGRYVYEFDEGRIDYDEESGTVYIDLYEATIAEQTEIKKKT